MFFESLSLTAGILIISSKNIYDDFISADVFFDRNIGKSFIDMFSAKKIVVECSHEIDKIALSNIINFAETKNIDVDFYARKINSDGFLHDSVEYLLINCESMSTFPI
jgi:hypothetical protein